MGNIYRVLYEDEHKNKSSLILKLAPTNLQRRKIYKIHNLFLREINMYDEVKLLPIKLENGVK